MFQYLWKQIRLFKNIHLSPPCPPPDDLCEKFFDAIAPPSAVNKINFLEMKNTSQNQFLADKIGFQQFLNALNSKRGSAPGHDLVTYSMIKNLPEFLKIRLVDIFNYFLLNNSYPSS